MHLIRNESLEQRSSEPSCCVVEVREGGDDFCWRSWFDHGCWDDRGERGGKGDRIEVDKVIVPATRRQYWDEDDKSWISLCCSRDIIVHDGL
jgi:hypothetical protein